MIEIIVVTTISSTAMTLAPRIELRNPLMYM